ncbi:MAG: hypothetical protein IJ173_04840 [Kiritimatiellae bacterium]|nr:hypothetical protein [Kiritimatiellia bacterium]
MKQLIAVIALSVGFGAFADSTFNWTCDFGNDYAAEVAKYVSLNTKATATKVTGSNTQKNGETYLVLSDAESKTVSGGITSTVNFPYEVKLANGGYTMEFDYAPTYGVNDQEATVYGLTAYDSNGDALFNLYGKKMTGGIDICKGADTTDVLASLASSNLTIYTTSSAEANWLHVTITGDKDGNKVTLAITKLSDGSSVFEPPVEPPVVVTNSYITLGKLTVKTAHYSSDRSQWAGLDDFAFEGQLPSGITEWTSGAVTESIVFGAALETGDAVAVSGGNAIAPVVFAAQDDNASYGLSIAGTSNMAIGDTEAKGSDAYFAVESGRYAVGGDLLVGLQEYLGNGVWSQDYITINDGTFSVAGNVVYLHGTMNVNGGTFTVGGTLNLANQNRASATINVNGGTLSAATIHVAPYAGDGPTLNVNGGTLEAGCFTRQHAEYTSKLFFNGGTLKALPSTKAFAPEGISFIVNAGGGTIDVNGQDIAIANAITGEGALTVKGGGKLTLSAAYGGTGALTVDSDTTLDLGGQTNTFASATIGGTVTNGTLVVTGNAAFTSGAVIDVGDLALADGEVVLACGSVDGLENLTVKANGKTVNYKLKYEASKGGIVLRRKGLVIVVK